jgi:hypothetical protein
MYTSRIKLLSMLLQLVGSYCVALCLASFFAVAANGQSESALSTRIVEALKAKEPDWKYVGGIESGRIPIVPSENASTSGFGLDRSHIHQTWSFPYIASRAVERRRSGSDQFATNK